MKTRGMLSIFLTFVFNLELLTRGKGYASVEYSVSDYLSIIILVCKSYQTRCVTFLYSPQDNSGENIRNLKLTTLLEKSLSATNKSMYSSVISLDDERYNLLDYSCPNRHRPLFVMLSTNAAVQRNLKVLSEKQAFSHPGWLLFLSNTSIENLFSDIYIPFDCMFMVAEKNGDWIQMTEVYMVTNKTSLLQDQFGRWRRNETDCTTLSLYKRRTHLHGIKVKGAVFNSPPVVILHEDERGIQNVSGYFGDIWNAIQKALNFTTEFKKAKGFGVKRNGTWNGMIQEVLMGRAEFAINEFTITPDRLKVVSFASPIIFSRYEFFIRTTRNDEVTWKEFLEPFSPGLWFTICGWIILLSLVLTTIHSFGRRFGNLETNEPQKYSLYNSFHHVFGIFCFQGQETEPRSTSCRIVWLVTYLSSVVLLAAYSASLISYLTREHELMPFTDLKGLLEDGSYRLGVMDNSAEYDLFHKSRNPLIRTLYDKYIQYKQNVLENYEEGVDIACAFKFVFMASYLLEHRDLGDCVLNYLPDESFPVSMTFVLAKHSPYRGLINSKLQKMRDLGAIKKLQRMWLRGKVQKTKNSWDMVNFNNVVPLLAVLAIAIFAAWVLLFIEIKWHNVQVRKLQGDSGQSDESSSVENFSHLRNQSKRPPDLLQGHSNP